MQLSNSLSRFGIASVAALGIDFIVTFFLVFLTPLPLAGSAAASFILVGLLLYFVHENWTFRREGAAPSPQRLLRTVLVFSLAWLWRIAIIAALEYAFPPDLILSVVYFLAGAAASLTVNYVGTRYWVFRQG